VAIGSLTAVEPHPQLGAYITFKAALAMLVRTVALENKDAGLTANVVLPGTMDTPANRKAMPNADFSKWIQPSDVVNLVLSLTADRASKITGTAIPIGGSKHIKRQTGDAGQSRKVLVQSKECSAVF
jgi:NAD(P)-dependent dehydrogenase (short-subunit alcohol dehydrogenase family)